MNPDRWESAKRLFHDALERPPAARDGFVRDVADTDAALYDAPFRYVETHVKPTRMMNARASRAEK